MQSPLPLDGGSAPRSSVNTQRDALLQRVAERAEQARQQFSEDAKACILRYLADHGPTSGEVLTDACKAANIRPHDDRAFGSVFMALARSGQIQKCGSVSRLKGHNTAGGNLWRLVR